VTDTILHSDWYLPFLEYFASTTHLDTHNVTKLGMLDNPATAIYTMSTDITRMWKLSATKPKNPAGGKNKEMCAPNQGSGATLGVLG